MSIVAVDPGTSNTGIVYMDERRIVCCKTLAYKSTVKADQYALKERAEAIAKQLLEWMADKPHECVVVEGFVPFGGERQGAYTFQTPYLCGYLHAALVGERVVIQTSDKVLRKNARGSMHGAKEDMARGIEVWPECGKLTNDHLRSAACHGIYYYRRKHEHQ